VRLVRLARQQRRRTLIAPLLAHVKAVNAVDQLELLRGRRERLLNACGLVHQNCLERRLVAKVDAHGHRVLRSSRADHSQHKNMFSHGPILGCLQ